MTAEKVEASRLGGKMRALVKKILSTSVQISANMLVVVVLVRRSL